MSRLSELRKSKAQRAVRARAGVKGTSAQPRLSVNISNMHISAQIVDDSKGITLASASTIGRKIKGTMTEKATTIGEQIAEAAKKAKVSKVVFDRGSKKYHGRVKALAEAARSKGLEF